MEAPGGGPIRPVGTPTERPDDPPCLWSGHIPVGDGHEIYVESIGTPGETPAVFLHGGPGSGCQTAHRSLFDPRRFHAVLIDQRGAGRSRPHGLRVANTTAHLVADLERVRRRFGFERWLLVGGSWGATLALAYAQQHPERVLGLVLRAVFLGTRAELEQAFGTNMATFFPQLHEDFLGLLPETDRRDPLPAYWHGILGDDPEASTPYARAWHDAERILSTVFPSTDRLDLPSIRQSGGDVPATPYMEAHYFAHECFLGQMPLLDNAHRLAGIPGVIVQGRHDLLCPPRTSAMLARRWRDCEVRVLDQAGHSLADPGVRDAVISGIEGIGLHRST
jgi:proline iminopeptidase